LDWLPAGGGDVPARGTTRGEEQVSTLQDVAVCRGRRYFFFTDAASIGVVVGFLSIGLAFAGILYALIIRLYTNDWVRGWTSIFTAVLFIGGAQLVTLGIIGEYIGRILRRS